jgi:hypothetical protein
MSVRWIILGLAVGLLGLPTAAAQAAYPGSNGKIAFVRGGQIWTANANGTGATQVTSDASPASEPEWSPTGKQIAYTRGTGDERRVRIMNADGTGDHVLFEGLAFSPTWAPDGSRVGYVNVIFYPPPGPCGCYYWTIETRQLDGSDWEYVHTGVRPLGGNDYGPVEDAEWSPKGDEFLFTNGSSDRKLLASYGNAVIDGDCCGPASGGGWSPDAEKVAYARSDGFPTRSLLVRPRSGGQPVTVGTVGEKAEWSPDGTRLLFDLGGDLYTSNPDGTGKVPITSTAALESQADWQPVIDTIYPGHARPKGATPLRIPLVVAYRQCGSPNSTHGPPLAHPSCNPPVQGSSYLTVGTPDANGAPAESVGWVKLSVETGDPASLTNEADVRVALSVTDVFCRFEIHPGVCHSTGSPAGEAYSGNLEADIPLRVTDRYNLPSQGGRAPGTFSHSLSFRVDCGVQAYGTCNMNTTVNAMFGPVLAEGRRTVWEVGTIRLWDEKTPRGPPRGIFLTQGLFVP